MEKNKNKLTLSVLGKISEQINSTITLEKLLNVIMATAKSMINCEGASLMLMDNESKDLYFNVALSEKGDIIKGIRVPLGVGIAGLVAQNGKAIVVNDAKNDKRIYRKVDEIAEYETKNLICVPMTMKNKLLGVIEVVNALNGKDFTKQDVALLTYIANQAAISINNRDMLDSLEKLNADLQARVKEISILFEISQSSKYTYNINELYDNALGVIVREMGVVKISLFIFDEDKNKLVLESSKGLEINIKTEVDVDSGIIGEVFKTGDPQLVSDINSHAVFKNFKKDYYVTNSFLSVPLQSGGKLLGVINVADKFDEGTFDMHDLIILSSIATQIASAVTTIHLERQILDQEKLKKELEAATSIQESILPKTFDSNGQLNISACSYPALMVGGDFYDFMRAGENKFGLLIGDVSGKGIPAAIFMALVRNVIRAEAKIDSSPSKIFYRSNRSINDDSVSGMFATAAYFLVDTHNQILTYSNAGHNPLFILRQKDREIEFLTAKGIPLGAMDDVRFEEKVTHYEKGDLLFLYTDGIVEALNDHQEEFGEERLLSFIRNIKNSDALVINEKLKQEILDFTKDEPQFDDLSYMIVKL